MLWMRSFERKVSDIKKAIQEDQTSESKQESIRKRTFNVQDQKSLHKGKRNTFGQRSKRGSAYWQSIPDEPRVVWAKVVIC
jgi:hypothetical protein